MSVAEKPTRPSPRRIARHKGRRPIVALTAYSTPMARLLDVHCDLILVGDSLGMVVYGLPTTVGVTLDMMIAHGQAVVRGAKEALVVVDLPFGTYQRSPEQAFETAARVLAETGCGAVKLEGGTAMAPTIAFLVQRGVAVLGHIGLQPQSVGAQGGFRVQGREPVEAERVRADARAVADAGAFAMVIEGTVEPLARELTEALPIPTIGIGASRACDGQILVTDDILGLFPDFTPRFARRYAQIGAAVEDAVARYAADVRDGRFPTEENVFR